MTNPNSDTLDSIITDLASHVFDRQVTLLNIVDHLKFLGGHEFNDVSSEQLLLAVKEPTSARVDWPGIAFGCDETLAYCHAADSSQNRPTPKATDELKLDACARLLAVGLLGDAAIQRDCDIGDYLHLSKVIYTLYAYSEGPFGGDLIPHLWIEEHIERLARYVFRSPIKP